MKMTDTITRRDFLRAQALAGVAICAGAQANEQGDMVLKPTKLFGGLREDKGTSPIEDAKWYISEKTPSGIEYRFPKGALVGKRYITFDMLSDQKDLTTYYLRFHETDARNNVQCSHGLIGYCSARVRIPLSFLDMTKWRLEREGAWLKPMAWGKRVRLENVDKIHLGLYRKNEKSARWCTTPLVVTNKTPQKMVKPILTKGKLLDKMGQMANHSWPGKTKNVEALKSRVQKQLADAPEAKLPASFSKWGGWKEKKLKASGFFRCEKSDGRWWLVDPDGHPFWSAGIDCVGPRIDSAIDGLQEACEWMPNRSAKQVDFLIENLKRALGAEGWKAKWDNIAVAQLKKIGFNSFGNWSDWQVARAAQFPYTRPLSFRPKRVGLVFRDFPDVFDSRFEQDAADYAGALRDSASDPAMIGYFMMNEPTWGFSQETPAVGMLYTCESCKTRDALAAQIKRKYGTAEKLANVWGEGVTFSQIEKGKWSGLFNESAKQDLTDFSGIMAKKYFETLSKACRKVDPNHLNLGIRYASVPPKWVAEGMRSFDVFSINNYKEKIPADEVSKIHDLLGMPVIIGEFHFGALDAGLPASGIGHVRTQEDRGKAYRRYVEDAAANPNCVGTHWFTLYDQSALGRFDGENYNIGFLDTCNRPYKPICSAARATHKALYDVASGKQKPFDDAPIYLPKLFL